MRSKEDIAARNARIVGRLRDEFGDLIADYVRDRFDAGYTSDEVLARLQEVMDGVGDED